MSDSDDDYIDIGEVDDIVDDVEGNESEVPEKNGIGRGKDIEWVEIARFKDKAAFETSHYFLDIKKYFTLRQGRESWYSDSEHYTCKFARKRSFVKCPLQYKVHFMTTSEEVMLQSNTRSHIHQEVTNYDTIGPNRHWTIEQTEIVMNTLRNDGSAKTIERNLRDANVFPKRIFQLEFSLTQKFNTVVLSLERLYRYLTHINCTRKLRRNWGFPMMILRVI